MHHVRLDHLAETKDIPDREIFAVHDFRERKSLYVLTASTKPEEWWCLAVKINGQMYMSDWHKDGEPMAEMRKAMQQIRFIKEGGWYMTNETMLDDINMFRQPKYRCAYCGAETTEPKGACICRRIATKK